MNKGILLICCCILISCVSAQQSNNGIDQKAAKKIIEIVQKQDEDLIEEALRRVKADESVNKVIEWYQLEAPMYKPDVAIQQITSVKQLNAISNEQAATIRAMSVFLREYSDEWKGMPMIYFARFKNLEYLKIEKTKQASFNFSGLNKLRTLNFDYVYNLPEIPASIGELKNLEHLVMTGVNSIKSIPESIYSLTKLKTLEVTGLTDVDPISRSIKNLQQLTYLSLSGVPFPDEVGELRNLIELHLHNTHEYIPYAAIYRLPKLRTLRLDITSEENLKGISALKFLKVLLLAGRVLTAEIGDIPNLEGLILEYDGKIYPDELQKLKKLKALRIGSNSLTDAPDFIPALINLRYLEIRGCTHLNKFGASYRDMKNIELIELLYNNQITTVPPNLKHIKDRIVIRL